MINELVVLATRLDSKGYTKEANYLDSLIKKASWDLVVGDPGQFKREEEDRREPIKKIDFSPELVYVPRNESGDMVATLSKKDAILLKRELEERGREGLSKALYALSNLEDEDTVFDPRLENLIENLETAHDALFEAYMSIDHIISGTGS
jgi:hypothetical protein